MDASFLSTIFGSTLPIAPEIILIVGALILPLIYLLSKDGRITALCALIAVVLSGIVVGLGFLDNSIYGTYLNMFTFNAFSAVMMFLFLGVAFLVILVSIESAETTNHIGEYYSLILVATVGMLFVASSANLLAIFVGVECVSIISYALVALKKNDPRSSEAAVKYLIIGGLSSGLALYGISMLYGLTGSIQIDAIAEYVRSTSSANLPFYIAVIALIAGYGFKISAVPFHMWAPDVYEGASTPVSMFLSTGSKKMGFVVLFKIFLVMFAFAQTGLASGDAIQYVFAFMAAFTMTVGNIVAISQKNIKRMLAYSSIAQAGYILIVLAVMSEYAMVGGMFHMITHVFMKGGAFIVVAALISAGVGEKISDYRGLAKRSPFVAAAMLIFLFSLAGIPPLAGFASKFVLFSSAVATYSGGVWIIDTKWMWLAFVAILNSAISLYYYARVVKAMYIEKPVLKEGETEVKKLAIKKTHILAILICVVLVIAVGLYPEPVLNLCYHAAGVFFGTY